MSKHTILFLAANPLGTTERALNENARAIKEDFERPPARVRWICSASYGELKLMIVHFSMSAGTVVDEAG